MESITAYLQINNSLYTEIRGADKLTQDELDQIYNLTIGVVKKKNKEIGMDLKKFLMDMIKRNHEEALDEILHDCSEERVCELPTPEGVGVLL